jgi:NitT/TauT family transport system ATP-binding protein
VITAPLERTQPAADTAAPRVSIAGVAKVYPSLRGDIAALDRIDLDIRDGEFLSLLGPSGCGKSTLLRLVAGLDQPSSGTIRIGGRPLAGPPEGLGMVFQRDVLLDWRTILDNVLLPIEFAGDNPKSYRRAALDLLALFGLQGFEDRRPWELSGGMRQRAAICRALVSDPQLLLMDEPFGALDALTRDELNIELQRIWQQTHKTVLFVTHSISEAVLLSDRVAVMAARPGRIVEILEIDFPRPRGLGLREEKSFGRYAGRIREIFEKFGILRTE